MWSSPGSSRTSTATAWTFTCPPIPRSPSQILENPLGYKALSDKSLADEVTLASARTSSTGLADDSRATPQDADRMFSSIQAKAWQLSWSPIKSLGMNLLMLYFGGANPGIFTVLILAYAFLNSFKTLLSVNDVFHNLEDTIQSIRDLDDQSSRPVRYNRVRLDISDTATPKKERRQALMRFLCSPFVLQKMVFVLICVTITSYILYHAAWTGILPWRSGDFLGLIPERKVIDRAVGMF